MPQTLLISLTWDHPLGIGAAIACVLMAVLVAIRFRRAGISVVGLLLAAASVGLLAAKVRVVTPEDMAPVVAIVDISASHQPLMAAGGWAVAKSQLTKLLASSGVPTIVAFVDSEARLVVRTAPGEEPELPDALPSARDGTKTDLAVPIPSEAEALKARRVVVVSDGAFDQARLRAAYPAASIYSISLVESLRDSARIEAASMPQVVEPNSSVVASVRYRSAAGLPVTLFARSLSTTGSSAPHALVQVELSPGSGELRERQVVLPPSWFSQTGIVGVEFSLMGGEANDLWPANNKATAVTTVGDVGPVLYIGGTSPASNRPVFQWLAANGEEPIAVMPSTLTSSNELLIASRLIVLDDVPINAFPDRGEAIRRVVSDLGVSLLVVGGKHAFGPGGYDGSPLELALPLDANPDPGQTKHHLMLLDVSASMGEVVDGRQRIAILREAVSAVGATMDVEDRVAILPFAQSPRLARPAFVPMDFAGRVAMEGELARMTAAGTTSILSAFRIAADVIAELPSSDRANNSHPPRVLLVSDGDSPSDKLTDFDKPTEKLKALGAVIEIVLLDNDMEPAWLSRVREVAPGLIAKVLRAPNLAQLTPTLVNSQTENAKARFIDSPSQVTWHGIPGTSTKGPPSVTTQSRTRVGVKLVGNPILVADTSSSVRPEPVAATWRYGGGHVAAIAMPFDDSDNDPSSQAAKFAWLGEAVSWLNAFTPPREFEAEARMDSGHPIIILQGNTQAPPFPLDTEVRATVIPHDANASNTSLVFHRIGPYQWQADFASNLGGGALASLVPEYQLSGQATTKRGRTIPIATPTMVELLPPLDSPRRLRDFVRETGGMVLASDVSSFPSVIEPLDAEERRITWALIVLALGSVAVAIWYRRRIG